MEASKLMKGCFIFITLMITIAINVEDNVITRLGFEPNYLVMALCAVVLTGLVMHRNLMLVVLVLLLSVGANMPEEIVSNLGVDRDYLLGVLVAVVLVPLIARILD